MARSRCDQHDDITRFNAPIAVDHGHAEERPTRTSCFDVAGDLLLGHARIMFERQRRDRRTALVGATDSGKVTTAPMSVRPRVIAAVSAATSKAPRCRRM